MSLNRKDPDSRENLSHINESSNESIATHTASAQTTGPADGLLPGAPPNAFSDANPSPVQGATDNTSPPTEEQVNSETIVRQPTAQDVLDAVELISGKTETSEPTQSKILGSKIEQLAKGKIHSDHVTKVRLEIAENPEDAILNINTQIKLLRESGFEYKYTYVDPNDYKIREVLINTYNDNSTEKDPIHPLAEQIQALQYLKGMHLISRHLPHKDGQIDFVNKIQKALAKYENEMLSYLEIASKEEKHLKDIENTHQLAEDFARILSDELKIDISKARQQVTMARDLGVMTWAPPSICTISKTASSNATTQTTVELARPLTIGEGNSDSKNDYYGREFTNLAGKAWFQDAKKMAGFKLKQETWLDNFFARELETLRQNGVAAPPSARWLPLPGNNQLIETVVIDRDNIGQITRKNVFKIVRTGITSAFDILSESEQVRLSTEQINELVRLQLQQSITEFKERYKPFLATGKKVDFFFSYQTLLSPFKMEPKLYNVKYRSKFLFRDNNARFIEMAKDAIKKIAEENKITDAQLNIKFVHTNSAINKLSSNRWTKRMLDVFKVDNDERQKKFTATADMIQFIVNQLVDSGFSKSKAAELNSILKIVRNGFNKRDTQVNIDNLANEFIAFSKTQPSILNGELAEEIVTRLRASYHLRELQSRKPPFDKLANHQRNLMQAALESLMIGSQACKLGGCKSARDRFGIFAIAIKIMQQNPAAMDDWKLLNAGIINSLKEGHHFSAMIYHSAVVKVEDVHKDFMKELNSSTQSVIKSLLRFAKTLGRVKPNKTAANVPIKNNATEQNINNIPRKKVDTAFLYKGFFAEPIHIPGKASEIERALDKTEPNKNKGTDIKQNK